MRALIVVAAAAALAAAACAHGPRPLEPVGAFSFETMYQGQPMTGKIVIDPGAAEGQYEGVVQPDQGAPAVPILEVTVLEREMTIVGDAGGDELYIVLTFDEDGVAFTGSWMIGFEGSPMTGKRMQPADG